MFFRIQSLFLILATALIATMFFTPMIRFVDGLTICFYEYRLTLIFTFVALVLSIVALLSYKKRMYQIRICNLNSLILLGYQIFLAIKFFTREPEMIYTVFAVFPIAAAILTFIAMRYVARDEAMIMAASRLRSSRRK